MTYITRVPVLHLKDKDSSTNLAGLGEYETRLSEVHVLGLEQVLHQL